MESANRSKGGILLAIIMALLVAALQAEGGEEGIGGKTSGPAKDIRAVRMVQGAASGRAANSLRWRLL